VLTEPINSWIVDSELIQKRLRFFERAPNPLFRSALLTPRRASEKALASRGHNSQQAFISIQTIHLMNFAKSDTLAPLNKKTRRQQRAATI
jgi:hypothetical protein